MPSGLHMGETHRWKVKATIAANNQTHIVIKPVEPHLNTNMLILTDRRKYSITLRSTIDRYMSSISWHYTQTTEEAYAAYQKTALQREEKTLPGTRQLITELNFKYRIRGNCPFKPLRVYDDDRRTYIHLPAETFKNPPIPTLQVQSGFKNTLVVYKVQANRYIVDQLFSAAALYSGTPNKHSCTIKIKKL